jgi:hypothetical protein
MKPMKLLKSNGFFFTAAFIIWMVVMIVQYAGHDYFPAPLPNELHAMLQAQQAQQQAQSEQSPAESR